MSKQGFCAQSLLEWYDHNRRDLPWRAKKDEKPNPYYVLLSEIMLQQTQVATVIPYFYRFIEHFPTINILANADRDTVMSLWTGLGYYSRARNLHRCAQEIMRKNGEVPDTVKELKALSGVGNYTAAAIASIAYNVPVVPIDGNVERLTARLFTIDAELPKAKKYLDEKAGHLNDDLIAKQRAGDFSQALFDVGATICKPKKPSCLSCPLSRQCLGYKKGIAETLPRKVVKSSRPVRYGIAFFIQDREGRILFRKRPAKGLLGGTLELPGTQWDLKPISLDNAKESVGVKGLFEDKGCIKHVFTHFVLKLRLYKRIEKIDLSFRNRDELWYDFDDIQFLPFSSLMKKLVQLGFD